MTTPDAILSIERLSKTYGTGVSANHVLSDLSFEVGTGEFICIVGPSGAGKSTLLRCLTGLMAPTSGRVALSGHALTRPSPRVSLVFQEYNRSLLPWSTVFKNVALPLAARRLPKAEVRTRALEAIASVGLQGTEQRHPWQLSGGMQQRVAIARALVTEPEVLVMDEPFASVDAQTRLELEDLTLRLQRDRGITVLLVTHDIDESIYLSDRVVVLSKNPATVQEIVTVPLGRDRDQLSTRQDPRFGELRSHVLSLIRISQLASRPDTAVDHNPQSDPPEEHSPGAQPAKDKS